MWLHEKLEFLDVDDEPVRLARIRAFELVFLLILLTEYWARAIPRWEGLAPNYVASLAIATLLCTAALWVPLRRLAFAGLALSHASVVWNEFPAAGNHAYLEVMLCTLCAGLDVRRRDDQVLFLRSVRWLVVLILFYSGVQKLVHGYWFRGEYLAFSLWIDTFRPVIEPLLAPDEYARLITFTRQPGDGPYLVDSLPLLVVSNGVYVAEMGVALLLLVPRARTLAVCAAMLLLLAIEVGARELFFGLIMVNALLLFPTVDASRRFVPLFAVVLGYLMLVRVGLVPDMVFY